jgi:hypothetical protein
MSDDDEIKMVVRVNRDANPELFNELKPKSGKSRTERFRTLATMALMGRFSEPTHPAKQAAGTETQDRENGQDQSSADSGEDKRLQEKKKSFKDELRKLNF